MTPSRSGPFPITEETPILTSSHPTRFDLTTGTFSLAGTNPGFIFFGFGISPAAPAPEASTRAAWHAGAREA